MEADLLTLTLDLTTLREGAGTLSGLIVGVSVCFWLGFWVGRATREG